MKENLSLFERAKAFILAHHRRKIWHRVITVMAVLVVFVTTYMLVLPALTMVRGELICGMEEHVHKSECYTTKYIFTCGMGDSADHEHTDDCLTAISVLTCEIPEHYHDDSCYAQPTEEGAPAAQPISSDDEELIIEDVVEQEAFPEDAFGENGLNAGAANNGVSLAEDEETETETETEPVYYCGLEEHKHSEACFDEEGDLICEKPVHVHSEECLVKETETETESETETMSETEAATEAASETETATEAVSETEAASEAAPETEAETGRTFVQNQDGTLKEVGQSESETEALDENETETNATNIEVTEAESETESELEAVSETEEASEAESETEEVSEAASEAETEAEEKETESESESEGMSEIETEAESETETETEGELHYICGLEEHTHSDENGCYTPYGELVCELEEHTHTEDCVGIEETESESETDVDTQPETENVDDVFAASASVDIEGPAVSQEDRPQGDDYGIMMMSISPDAVDMRPYILEAYFSSTQIESNESVKVSIDYQVQSSTLKDAHTNKLEYELPEGIIPVKDYSGNVKDKSGNVVGKYFISKAGKITIELNQDFIDSGNRIDGHVEFWSTLTSEGSESGEKLTFSFSEKDSTEAEITVKKKDEQQESTEADTHDVSIQKEYVWDDASKTAHYTVKIDTIQGTGELEFSDRLDLSPWGVTGSLSGLKIVKSPDNLELKVDDYFVIDTNGNIKMKEGVKLPSLNAGESYTLTYDVQYSNIDDKNCDVELKNHATVNDDFHYDSTTAVIRLEHTYLTKNSVLNAETGEITWTITVNDFGADLDGYNLKDILKENDIIVDLPGSFTMVEYKADGTTQDHQIKIDPEEGYTFRKDQGYDTKSKFVITYKTPVDTDAFYSKYDNKATLTGPDGSSYEASHGQTSTHYDGVIDKQYLEYESGDIRYDETVEGNSDLRHYHWSVVINAPSEGIKEGAIYTDTMSTFDVSTVSHMSVNKAHYITEDQLNNLKVEVADEYGKYTSLDDTYYEVQIQQIWDDYGWVTYSLEMHKVYAPFAQFRVVFKQDLGLNTKKVRFSYETTADMAEMSNGMAWQFRNEGRFEQDGGTVSDYDEKKESQGGYFRKVDIGGKNGNYVYDETKGIMYYVIKVNELGTAFTGDEGTITITDILPEGTTLYRQPYDISKTSDGYSSNASGSINDKVVKLYFNNQNNQKTGYFDSAWGTNPTDGVHKEYKLNELASWSYDPITRKLEVKFPAWVFSKREDGSSYVDSVASIGIFYAAQITDALGKQETKTYTNNAEIYVDDEKKGSDSVTNTVTSSYLTKGINSDVSDLAANQVAYRVLINPTGATLNGGHEVKLLDTVKYPDEFLKEVSIKPGSFHLYHMNSDGSKGREADKSSYTVTYGEKSDESGKRFEVEITLRDSTAYILEYVYTYTVDSTGYMSAHNLVDDFTYTIKNDVVFSGHHEEENGSSEGKDLLLTGSDATASTSKLILSKVDKDNQVVYLPGAVFELQKYTGPTDSMPDDFWSNEEYWQFQKRYQTGENGTVALSGVDDYTAYRLVEVEAPTNYELNEDPYYFFITGTRPGSVKPEGFSSDSRVHNVIDSIVITDTRTDEDKTSVGVKKLWKDSNGKTIVVSEEEGKEVYVVDAEGHKITGVKVELYQTTEPDDLVKGKPYTDENIMGPVTLTFDEDGNWYHVFKNLPKDNGAELGSADYESYYYYVKEIGVVLESGEEITELSDSYIVTIDSEKAVQEGTITITNTQKKTFKVEKVWKDADGNVIENPSADDVPGIEVTLYRAETVETETEPETETEEPELETEYKVSVEVYYDNPQSGKQKLEYDETGFIKSTGGTVVLRQQWKEILTSKTLEYRMGSETGTIDGVYLEDVGEAVSVAYRFAKVTGDITLIVFINQNYLNLGQHGDMNLQVINEEVVPDPDTPATKNPIKYQGGEKVESVTLNAANNWKHTWYNLDGEGYYYVLENVPEGYTAEYAYDPSVPGEGAPIKKVTITNVPTDSDTYFRVKKEWVGVNADSSYVVNAKLSYTNSEGEFATEEFTLTAADGWQMSWKNLDGSNFKVEEVSVTINGVLQNPGDYTVTYSDNNGAAGNDATITITNTKVPQNTSVSVEKKWLASDGKTELKDKLPESLTVQLYREDNSGEWKTEGDSVELTAAKEWKHTWENLPNGNYRVEEKVPETGHWKVTYQVEDDSIVYEDWEEISVDEGTIIITNQDDSTKIEVEKRWSDDNSNHSGDSVTMELYSSTTPPETEAQTDPKEPDTDPNPDTEETDPVDPNPPTETTVTPKIVVDVTKWLDANGSEIYNAPSSGWIWVKAVECDINGNAKDPTHEETPFDVALGPDKWRVEGSLWPMKLDETKYYIIQCGAGGLGDDENHTPNEVAKAFCNESEDQTVITVTGAGNVTVHLTGQLRESAPNITVNVQIDKWLDVDGKTLSESATEWGWIGAWQIGAGNTSVTDWTGDQLKSEVFNVPFGPGNSWATTFTLPGKNAYNVDRYHVQFQLPKECGYELVQSSKQNDAEKHIYYLDILGGAGKVYDVHLVAHKIDSSGSLESIPDSSVTISDGANTISNSLGYGTYGVGNSNALMRIGGNVKLPDTNKTPLGTVTLGSAYDSQDHYSEGGWHYTWDNLPKTDEDGNPLYYYVVETDPGNGYTASYEYEYVDGDPTKGISKVKVTNTPPPEPETTKVTVVKQWKDQDGNEKTPDSSASIQVQLYNSTDSAMGGPVTLNSGNSWTYTWDDLPIGETYWVEELGDSSNYTVTYSTTTEDAGSSTAGDVRVNSGTIYITNKSTSIEVKKVWKGIGEKDPTYTPNIKVQLYKKTDDGSETVGAPVELTAPDWTYNWENLPIGEYYVEEEEVPNGFKVSYKVGSVEEGEEITENVTDPKDASAKSGTLTIINEEESTEFEVEKLWSDGKKADHESVTVQLYSSTEKPPEQATEQAENVKSTLTITVDITQWINGSTSEVDASLEPIVDDTVNMVVQPCTTGGRPIYGDNGEAVVFAGRLSRGNGWRQTTGALPATVEKDGKVEVKNYLVTFSTNSSSTANSIQKLRFLDQSEDAASMLITGTDQNEDLVRHLEATVSSSVEGQIGTINTRNSVTEGQGAYEAAAAKDDVGLNLPGDAKEVGAQVELGNGKTHASSSYPGGSYTNGGWGHKWSNLPKVDKDGNTLYYYVKEVKNGGENYTTSYHYQYKENNPEKGIELVTITNTLKRVKITAHKVWEWNGPKPSGADESKFNIQLSLYRDDETTPYLYASLCAANEWYVVWDNLEVGHTYTVKETVHETAPYVFQSVVTYGWNGNSTEPSVLNGDGEVTVTNTYNPTPYTLPETGGTGTLPYTVGGALLTALATLLLYIQNKRRKEGQGTS